MLNTRESGSDVELLDIKRALAALDVELKLCRIGYLLRKYSTDQPRVPAGSPEGGQWTSGGGGGGGQGREGGSGSEANVESPDPGSLAEGRSASEGDDDLPYVPQERPAAAQERNAIIKEVAKVPSTELRRVFEYAPWLYAHEAEIRAYQDPAKTLEELQQDANERRPGYDIHHLVEQTPAAQEGYPRSMIDAPENLVRVPRLKHWEINGWYQTPDEDFDDLTPRQYLRGRTWDERVKLGVRALTKFGVLGP
jgi:hypothetical protein